MKYRNIFFLFGILTCPTLLAEEEIDTNKEDVDIAKNDIHVGEKMVITTSHKPFPDTTIATPSFEVTKEDINKTNLISASDAIKFAPSVHVRRRFFGDTNGVTAIRGSGNFQTNHFNLFVDGIPLHNPVQTRFNGSPKWQLIAPNSIHSATVFYGPYSAEHRGSFGGTFDLKTDLPEDFEMSVDVTGIIQDSRRFGIDETLTGHKEFVSAGNRFGKWSVFGFYNRLENEGQAQSFAVNDEFDPAGPMPGTQTVSGARFSQNVTGDPTVITGDDGLNENTTNLYALKLGYDFTDDFRGLLTVAYEDTERSRQARSFIRDAVGNRLFDGTVQQNGQEFEVNPSSFGRGFLNGNENERDTLAYALNLSGKISENWSMDTTASYFDAFMDRTLQSTFSENDPRFETDQSGRINDIDVWWADASMKLATQNFLGRDDLGFLIGYQYNHSSLTIESFNSSDVRAETKDDRRDADGGDTETHTGFMQADFDITDQINLQAGMRYDYWQTNRGKVDEERLDSRDASRLSPKTSLAFTPNDVFSVRYSFSKAYRFPVAEELFNNSTIGNVANISDPTLAPESGFFHDLVFRYELAAGYASATVFYNEIEDEIQSIVTVVDGGGTQNETRGVGETETIGIELAYVQDFILGYPFSLSVNGAWLNKQITEDRNNPDLVGADWVRVPKWRANGILTYHATPNWDVITSFRYRSRQHIEADNSDAVSEVFGSSSKYLLWDFKTSYSMDVGHGIMANLSVGIENILDQNYFDFHPYPQRTFFARIGFNI